MVLHVRIWKVRKLGALSDSDDVLGSEPGGNYSHVVCVLCDSWLCWNTLRLWAEWESVSTCCQCCWENDFPGKEQLRPVHMGARSCWAGGKTSNRSCQVRQNIQRAEKESGIHVLAVVGGSGMCWQHRAIVRIDECWRQNSAQENPAAENTQCGQNPVRWCLTDVLTQVDREPWEGTFRSPEVSRSSVCLWTVSCV